MSITISNLGSFLAFVVRDNRVNILLVQSKFSHMTKPFLAETNVFELSYILQSWKVETQWSPKVNLSLFTILDPMMNEWP